MAKISRSNLQKRLGAIRKAKHNPSKGFELERIVLDLLRLEGLDPTGGFRPTGEQIDGFFEFDHRYFHLECKLERSEIPVADIYAFRGKFEGKMMGTMGLFVSMSGFSKNVPEVLRYGKTIDVILFNADDILFAVNGKHGFSEILRMKLRRAAQFGEPYYPFKTYLDELHN